MRSSPRHLARGIAQRRCAAPAARRLQLINAALSCPGVEKGVGRAAVQTRTLLPHTCTPAPSPEPAHLDEHIAQRLLLQVVRPPVVVQLQGGQKESKCSTHEDRALVGVACGLSGWGRLGRCSRTPASQEVKPQRTGGQHGHPSRCRRRTYVGQQQAPDGPGVAALTGHHLLHEPAWAEAGSIMFHRRC